MQSYIKSRQWIHMVTRHPFITFANVCLVLVTQVHKADLCSSTETRMVCSVFSLTITMILGEISVKPGVRLVERSCSVVECRTRNQVSPGSNPPLLPFQILGIFVLSIDKCCINEYLTIDGGGNVSDLVLARNCCLARMLPGEAELVSEWTGLSGKAKKWCKAL